MTDSQIRQTAQKARTLGFVLQPSMNRKFQAAALTVGTADRWNGLVLVSRPMSLAKLDSWLDDVRDGRVRPTAQDVKTF